MCSNNGWIELHRALLENPVVMKSAEHCAIWNCLLLMATHTDRDVIFDGKRITLKRGQLITGRKALASLFHKQLSESKVQRILKDFEIEHQIEQQTCSQNRLITIVNWELYQKNEQPSEQQVNNDRTTSEQRVNTNNNDNNYNNDNNKYSAHFEKAWSVYLKKKDKALAYKAYNARLNNGFSEEELYEAAVNYMNECRKKGTPEQYIKNGATFWGVNTPFVDYLPKRDSDNDELQDGYYVFPIDEYYKANPPYFGFPEKWFENGKLINERMKPIRQLPDLKQGTNRPIDYSINDLIQKYNERREWYERENNGF